MENEQQSQQRQYASAAGQTETVGRVAPDPDPASPARSRRSVRLPTKLRGIKWRWVLLGVVVVAAIAGAVAAWQYFNSPSRIIGQAFSKLSTVKTLRFDAKATTQIKGLGDLVGTDSSESDFNTGETENDSERTESSHVSGVPVVRAVATKKPDQGSPVDVSLGINGVTDVSNPEQPKVAATIKLAGQVAKVTLLSASLDVKSIGTTGYFRLGNLVDSTGLGGSMLNPIKGQWVKVSEQDINQASGEDNKQSEALKLPDREKIKKLTALANKDKLITFEPLPDDSIDGQPAHHYRYTLNKQHLETFVPQASQIISNKPLSEDETKQITEGFSSIDFNPGEIWIGKKDGLPHKITLGIQSHSKDFSDVILSLTMNDFDKSVKIEAPANAKSFEELQKQLYGDSLDGFDRNKDTDGDGHSDTEEVDHGFDPYGPGRLSESGTTLR